MSLLVWGEIFYWELYRMSAIVTGAFLIHINELITCGILQLPVDD